MMRFRGSAIATGPIVPRDAPPGPNASNNVVPAPSVHTIPACVGRPPGAAGLNVNVIPVAPEPLKKELPAVPEPSIAPSSASTESVIPPGANGAAA